MNQAEAIVRALGGEWRGNAGSCPCPCCQVEGRRDQRALSVTTKDGRLLLYCHRGECEVYAELRARGLITGSLFKVDGHRARAEASSLDREKEVERLAFAHRIFDESVSCENTPAAVYLASRGLGDLRFHKLRRTLRFHPAVRHNASDTWLPAMIAQVRGPGGERMGIHRTYLTLDGRKADVRPNKMALGPIAEGAVRFGPDAPVICLAEGIETALSISRASRMTTWACISASGMRGLVLPPLPVAQIVILAADNDKAGIDAATVAAQRFEAEGRRASIIFPTGAGQDWNDVLTDVSECEE